MTDDELNRLDALAQAATRGPWLHEQYQRIWNTAGLRALENNPTLADSVATEHQVVTEWTHGQTKDKVAIFGVSVSWCFETPYAPHVYPEDAAFIAASRTAIPALIAEIRRLRALRD